MNPEAIEGHFKLVLIQWMVIIAAAWMFGRLGKRPGQPPREAGSIAVLMNTRGLMALVAINVGLELKLLTPALFTMLVIMALLTTARCEPLLCWRLPKELRERVPK